MPLFSDQITRDQVVGELSTSVPLADWARFDGEEVSFRKSLEYNTWSEMYCVIINDGQVLETALLADAIKCYNEW